MNNDLLRRGFLQSLGVGALVLLGAAPGRTGPLSAAEKEKLKGELQRELERRVYGVDEALFRQVNRARDPKSYEGHERGHVPKIVAPKTVRRLEAFDVRIEVGVEKIHEMQVFHYIDWIGLQVDDIQVNSTTMTPLLNRPVVTFQLTLEKSAMLTAREHCNLHGTWESSPLRVAVV